MSTYRDCTVEAVTHAYAHSLQCTYSTGFSCKSQLARERQDVAERGHWTIIVACKERQYVGDFTSDESRYQGYELGAEPGSEGCSGALGVSLEAP